MDNVIGVRLSDEEKSLIRQLAEARGEDMSTFIRRSVKAELARLGFASDTEVRALGLDLQPHRYGNPLAGGG